MLRTGWYSSTLSSGRAQSSAHDWRRLGPSPAYGEADKLALILKPHSANQPHIHRSTAAFLSAGERCGLGCTATEWHKHKFADAMRCSLCLCGLQRWFGVEHCSKPKCRPTLCSTAAVPCGGLAHALYSAASRRSVSCMFFESVYVARCSSGLLQRPLASRRRRRERRSFAPRTLRGRSVGKPPLSGRMYALRGSHSLPAVG